MRYNQIKQKAKTNTLGIIIGIFVGVFGVVILLVNGIFNVWSYSPSYSWITWMVAFPLLVISYLGFSFGDTDKSLMIYIFGINILFYTILGAYIQSKLRNW